MSKQENMERVLDSISYSPLIRARRRKEFEKFSARRLKRLRRKLTMERRPPLPKDNGFYNRAEQQFQAEFAPGLDLEGDDR